MVKHNNQVRQGPASDRSSAASAGCKDNIFCVVLHVVEAINFYGCETAGERDRFVMNASLNSVNFEVEGTPSLTNETIIFNSNCIWECDLACIKCIKTDHRPVKVSFFSTNDSKKRQAIGSLLLPIRAIPVLGVGSKNKALILKMFWHKLICINSKFRSQKPEVLLMLAIIKKSLLFTKDFKHLLVFNSEETEPSSPPRKANGHSITASMMQSQANIYVQSLVQLGLLQVGNNPLVDCDIIVVVLQFKQLKNVNKLMKSLYHGKEVSTVLLMFDFVGNVTNIELKLNDTDFYMLDDVFGLRFKSSLHSIKLYFQRIFYLPINMYINGTSIANYRVDFAKLMPPDKYFVGSRKYEQNGSFTFERFGKMSSAREVNPIMDYTFTVEIQEVNWRHGMTGQEHVNLEQQSSQMMSSEIDLNAVGNEAVIHEVPNDRIVENPVQWEHSSQDKISVASLDVGAELSNSEPEQDIVTEMPLSDRNDSDDSQTGSKFNGQRKKFTRLMEHKPASQVFTNIQGVSTDMKEEDNMNDYIKKCTKSLKRTVKETTEIVNTKVNSVKSMDRHKLNLENVPEKMMENESLAKEFRPKTVIKELKNDDFQNYDIVNEADKNVSFPLQLQNKSSIKAINNELKKGTLETKSPAEQLKPNVISHNINEIRSFDEIENVYLTETPREQIKTNVLTAQQADLKKKKKSSRKTKELDTLSVKEVTKTPRKLKINIKDEEEHLNNIEKNDLIQKPKRHSLRRKVIEKQSHDLDHETGTEKQELNINKSTNQIFNTESFFTDPKVAEKLSPKKSKAGLKEKSELSLSARWVEINKKQIKLLEETEKFLGKYGISNTNIECVETNLASDVDNDKDIEFEGGKEVKNVLMAVSKKTIQDVPEQESSEIDSQERKSFQLEAKHARTFDKYSASSCSETTHKRSVRPLVEDSCAENSIECDPIIIERPVKNKSLKNSVTQSALQEAETNEKQVALQRKKTNKRKQIIETTETKEVIKANFDLDTVDIFETLKLTKETTESVKKSTNCLGQSDNTELDESTKKILLAAMQLQDDMKQKSLKYIQSLGQQNEDTTVFNNQSLESLKGSSTEVNYLHKFKELEQHISLLEDHLYQFENRTREMQEENFNLSNEKLLLKKRIKCMEQQIEQLRDQKSSDNKIQMLLAELRQQYSSYNDVVKAKEHYKKQWRRAARRIHALKLAMYEKNVSDYKNPSVINLRNILTKESEEFEREFGRFRKTEKLHIPTENDSDTPPLKDYLFGLSTQTLDKHKPGNHFDSTRMH